MSLDDRTRPTFAIRNVAAVLDDQVLNDATVVVRDGVIESVGDDGDPTIAAIDGGGAFCLPGLIDIHSDGLEKELRPRPSVLLPVDFALRSFEAKVRGAGVTTVFHGVAFEDGDKYNRSIAQAEELYDAIGRRRSSGEATIDHRILHRLDIRDRDGREALEARLGQVSQLDEDDLPLVSAEDHTPGVGQYRDRTNYERYVAGTKGLDAEQAKRYIDDVLADREGRCDHLVDALDWLARMSAAGLVRSMVHDPTSAAEIDEAIDRHATIAEFPTTLPAAQRAIERGLGTVAGAPNVLRGGSHSGNVAAADLVVASLCSALASDYLPSALLGAVGVLVDDGVCDMPTAVRLVTAGPADLVGLPDRGRLAPGQRGDIVLAAFDGRLPTVRLVVGADDVVSPVPSTLSAVPVASGGN